MANGIKLRRGLKTALAGTIADGEFVFCTDSGELGFKKGTVEKYIDLEKLSTDIDDLQTDVDELQAKEVSLLPGQFKVSVNKFYDFDLNPQSKPTNKGGFRIPIAKVNPLYIGNEFPLEQVFNFTNSIIQTNDFDSYADFKLSIFKLDNIIISGNWDSGNNRYKLHYTDYMSSTDLGLDILDDGYGNFNLWLNLGIDAIGYSTSKVIIAFDMYCISEVGEDLNYAAYNVFLPPLGLEITPYNGAV